MRNLLAAAALALTVSVTPALASERDAVMADINAFYAALDKGDMAAVAKAHTANPAILDEFAPHHWSTLNAWLEDFGKDSQKNGITGSALKLVKVRRVLIEGDHAYVATATDYVFKQKGKPRVEHAMMTFALEKTADGWKIASWAFSY
jgi:ketosteroid isomerase-like protein